MSDNIPLEIQVEIIKRLPMKSVVRFQRVSKTWKRLICSSGFIAGYRCSPTHLQHLFVSSFDGSEHKYVSIADDHNFPKQQVPLSPPLLVKMLTFPSILGSSHGLLCLHSNYLRYSTGENLRGVDMVVFWNVSISKAVAVIVPNVENGNIYRTLLGFGVCCETNDPKIVKINEIGKWKDLETISCIPNHVEVFTLSTGVWRCSNSNLPRKSIRFGCFKVVIDGFLYWLSTDRVLINDECNSRNLIILFDMTSESFTEVNLPDGLVKLRDYRLSMSKLRESLVVLEHAVEANNRVFVVWMMGDGVPKSFIKLFTINANTVDAVRGFRKSGEPIIEVVEDQHGTYKLVVYEPSSKSMKTTLGINGSMCPFSLYPYMKTLLLLDHPNFTVYDKMKTLESKDEDFFEGLRVIRFSR